MVLIYLRGIVPDFVSLVLSNTLVLGGTLILYIGLQNFFDKKSAQVYNYILLAVFVLLQSYFSYIRPDLEIRTINTNAGLLILCFQCMWLLLFRLGPDTRPITRGAGISFGCIALTSLVRVIGIIFSPMPNNDFFKSGVFDSAMLLAQQLLFFS